MTYRIEVFVEAQQKFVTLRYGSLSYCKGYLDGMEHCAPRLPYRIVNDKGDVVLHLEGNKNVSIGMIAGHPTPEQYRWAAEQAMQMADKIEKLKLKGEK